jgi:hypothetical protein
VNATVSFTGNGKTTGNYGTISIPAPQTFLGGTAGTTTCYFKHGTNFSGQMTCDDTGTPVQLTIKFINGKAGVVGTGTTSRFGILQANNCSGVNNFFGAENKEAIWTKQ